MNNTELQLAATILKGCIKVRQDKLKKMEDTGDCYTHMKLSTLKGEIDDLTIAIAHIEDLML